MVFCDKFSGFRGKMGICTVVIVIETSFIAEIKKTGIMSGQNSTEHINEVMRDSVSEETNVAEQEAAITKLDLRSHTAYIDADPYISDPYALLGMVLQVRKIDGNCPEDISDPNYKFEFTPFPIQRKVSERSKLSTPVLRSSIVVDKSLAANVSFLNYLSAELSAESFFSLMVFDQARGVIDQHDADWVANVKDWRANNQDILNDPEICYLFAISGFVQKNIVRKKYKKFEVGAKGGAFGLNIGGELATSTDEYSLDIKFGITPIVLKRPTPPAVIEVAIPTSKAVSIPVIHADISSSNLIATPSLKENKLFEGLTGSTFQNFTTLSK